MKTLILDFETIDPYIGKRVGAGWAYELHNQDNKFRVLGAAVKTYDNVRKYVTDPMEILRIVKQHDAFVAHNATYELGCLYVLVKTLENKDLSLDKAKELRQHIKNMEIYDTKLLFKLHNSSLQSYTLDNLAKKYGVANKGYSILEDIVWDHDLYPWLKKELEAKAKAEKKGETYIRQRPDAKKLRDFGYKNMDVLHEVALDRIADYALLDVDITETLDKFVRSSLDKSLVKQYSKLVHVCVSYRMKGVRIDLKRCREIKNELLPIIASKCAEAYEIAGKEFNINSPKELPPIFDALGIKYPLTEKGNPSITTPWLEQQPHPICQKVVEARKYKKIHGDFIEKILEMQENIINKDDNYGRLFPELNILEARTGRFSCSNPNTQQIPSRDPVLGPMCRSIFIPEEGQKWYSLDFSNQEGRLQVHYAYLLGCEGAAELVEQFKKDPNFDMHQQVADMIGISRRDAKTINLGISYGMGIAKLAHSLGISEGQARIVKNNYDLFAPFLAELNRHCKKAITDKGYIKTLGGRHVHNDPPVFINGDKRTFEYKALNKLIQGSAADQTIAAMLAAYDHNIPVIFPVHDEIVISGTYEQAKTLKKIMESAILLTIPSVTEIKEGSNWAEAK